MTNAELFDSWKGLDDHELSIELARVTGEMLVIHREELVERGTTMWNLKDTGDMLAHNF